MTIQVVIKISLSLLLRFNLPEDHLKLGMMCNNIFESMKELVNRTEFQAGSVWLTPKFT